MSFFQPSAIIPPGIRSAEFRVGLATLQILLRGALSGAYIGMGAGLVFFVSTGMDLTLGSGFARLIGGAVFPLGIILTVLTGAELFAGDGMLTLLAAFRRRITLPYIIRFYILVWIGNLIGALFFAALITYGPFLMTDASGSLIVTPAGVAAVSMAAAKCTPAGLTGFFSLLVKAVICGWLVNIAVLLALCADDLAGKFMGVWFPMMTMMATGHEFAVANMMMIPAGILVAAHLTPIQVAQVGPDIASLGFSEMWINLIGVSIGNLLGGILFAVLIFGSLLRPNFYKT